MVTINLKDHAGKFNFLIITHRTAEPCGHFSAESAAGSPIESCIDERCFLFGGEFVKELIDGLLFHIGQRDFGVPFEKINHRSVVDLGAF